MTRFPPTPPAFTERHAVIGRFIRGGRDVAGLDCLLDVSLVGSHPVIGYVLGDKSVGEEIKRVEASGEASLRFEGAGEPWTFRCDRVLIRRTSSYGRSTPASPNGLTGIACVFQCPELSWQIKQGRNGEQRRRQITFFLHGPRAYWPSWSVRKFSFTGSVTNFVTSTSLLSRQGLPFTIKPRPYFVYSLEGTDRKDWYRWSGAESRKDAPDIDTSVQTLVMETSLSSADYSSERFLADAVAVVEDLCLLVSFLSQGLVNWYSYTQTETGTIAGFLRPVVPSRRAEPSQFDEMVPLAEGVGFLSRSFRTLRRLRARGIDLRLALTYAFAAGEVAVVSQKLGVFYLALEAALKAHPTPKQRDVPGFDRCKREVLEAVHSYAAQRKKRHAVFNEEWWRQKVGELSRPSFWQALEPLLRRYRVGWRDLYPLPGPSRPTFIAVRNKLVHAGVSDNDETLLKETLRLKAVVQRLLLRSLGWEDLWNVPDHPTKYFLSGRKELPEGADLRLLGRSRRTRRRTKKRHSHSRPDAS